MIVATNRNRCDICGKQGENHIDFDGRGFYTVCLVLQRAPTSSTDLSTPIIDWHYGCLHTFLDSLHQASMCITCCVYNLLLAMIRWKRAFVITTLIAVVAEVHTDFHKYMEAVVHLSKYIAILRNYTRIRYGQNRAR